MKKHILLATIMLLTFSNYAQTTGSWATKKSLGNDLSARENAGMVSLNNKLYILAGSTSSGPKDFTEYNPITGELNKLHDFPAGNRLANRILFAVQGKIYTFSGMGSGVTVYDFGTNDWTQIAVSLPISPDAGFVINDIIYLTAPNGNDFYAFNTVTNTFTQKANYPGMAGAMAFDINGKGYYGSGTRYNFGCSNETCFTNSFYEYNPVTDSWTTKASIPSSFYNGVGIGLNGKGYVGMGDVFYAFGSASKKSSAWYEYDPNTDVWTQKQGVMNNPYAFSQDARASCSISKIGNEIYIFGGRVQNDGNYYTDSLIKYDTSTNNWQNVNADLGKNRASASGFYANGKIYIGNGEDSIHIEDFWEYNIATNEWTEKAGSGVGHYERSTVEINGKGYFIGGYCSGCVNTTVNPTGLYIDDLLEYNPATNIWTQKAPYPGGKRTGMVSFAHNGKLYAGLGRNGNGAATSDFYEYNITTNSWTSLASAPITGMHLSYFVLNDIGYIVAFGPSMTYKYNFSLNTWSSEANTLSSAGSPKNTNQAFTYQGKAYIVNATDKGDQLSEYNPTTGTWKQTINLPYTSQGQSIIVSPNSVYFGFGYNSAKIRNTNDWQELRFNAGVSDNVGVYSSISNSSCGTGILSETATNSIYDEQGDLFLTLQSGTSLLESKCIEVNSIDLNQNFRTASANFGNGFLEKGMFLNKSILFQNSSAIGVPDVLRLYYTTTELNKLVQDFNVLYNSNKTLQDIKLVQNYVYSSNDNNPFNNSNYVLYSPTLKDYGTDKYFEITPSTGNVIGGEIYAVILLGTNLETTSFNTKITSIYPNPTNSILNINTENNTVFNKIVVTDLAGKIILEQTQNTNQINVQNLANGIYLLEAVSGNEKWHAKFIKK
jgi:N-acetylneuraminic acid mutarotase